MIKISIIMPIYNAEKYLERSIESIQKQTLQNIEIILVNDGSTDNSLSICRKYAKEDKRIKIVDKPNGGVSSARNVGMEIATGEYIGFVDADDWIKPKMYENMYHRIQQTQADICMCNYMIDNNGQFTPIALNIKQELLGKNEIVHDIIANMISAPTLNSNAQTIMGTVCRLVIKKDLIDQYYIGFQEEILFMEDLIFCIQALLKSSKVCIDRGFYYFYCINSNSAVLSFRKDMMKERQRVFQTIKNMLTQNKLDVALERRLKIRYVNDCINLISNELHKENHKKEIEKIRSIYVICRDEKLKMILKTINTKMYSIRKRTVLFAMKHELVIFLYLYYSIVIKILN